MATRQPRRTRRRTAPATSLPRPTASADAGVAASAGRRTTGRHRAHHVTTDYRYVRTDLTAIAIISTVAFAFVVGMAIYIGAI